MRGSGPRDPGSNPGGAIPKHFYTLLYEITHGIWGDYADYCSDCCFYLG